MVERCLRDAGLGDHPVDPDGMDAVAGEEVVGGLENPLARVVSAQRIALGPVFGSSVYLIPPIVP